MAIANLLICYLADRTRNRCLWAIFSLIVPVVCFALMLTLPQHNLQGQLIAFTFAGTFLASFSLLLSLIASNVAGQTKKTTVNTIISELPAFTAGTSPVNKVLVIGYCIGFLVGPFTAHLSDAPRYVNAKITVTFTHQILSISETKSLNPPQTCALFSFAILVLVAIRFLASHRNSAKEKKLAELGDSYHHVRNQEFMDLTDME
jgi:ACS family allantoate permease-like MFS transporter